MSGLSGFGIDCIDQTDLIPRSKNEKQNKIQAKGISVTDYIEATPCEGCRARGLEYYCSLADDYTSELGKIRTVKSTLNKPNLPEQNSDHSSECFYSSIMYPYTLLID